MAKLQKKFITLCRQIIWTVIKKNLGEEMKN